MLGRSEQGREEEGMGRKGRGGEGRGGEGRGGVREVVLFSKEGAFQGGTMEYAC